MVQRVVLLVLVVFSNSGLLIAQPSARETWHVYLAADGTAYGSIHTVVSPTENGNWQYSISTRLLLDFLGAQRQELTGQTTIVVTPEFRPVSFRAKGQELSGSTKTQGVVVDGKLLIEVERAGVLQKRQVELTDGLIPTICLDDWLSDRAPDFEQGNVRLINDGDEWQVAAVTVKRASTNEKGTKWRVNYGGVTGDGMVDIGADGVMNESAFSSIGTRIRRANAEQARNIQYTAISGRSVLMFPMNKDISNPSRIEEMTVKLTWKDIPFEDFDLQDNRQTIIERSELDGDHIAIVRIAIDNRGDNRTAFPITDPKLSEYLSDTRFIKPNNKDIKRVATEIVEGKQTASDAVTAIADWVFDNVESTLIVETLSGPEVLATKKGKCSEYSTLFASLGRSAGIPTRIVLGERLTGGHWIGHMWNEAYVGQWITVDASANEVGNSGALLKLVHSDTVMGTQPLRFALPKSLDLSIEDFRMRDTGAPSGVKTGIEGTTYANSEYACSIAAPNETWTLDDKSKPGLVTIQFKPKDNEDVHVYFVAFGVPQNIDAKTLINSRLNAFKSRFKDRGFEIIKNEACNVNGAIGHTITYQRQWPDDPNLIAKSTEYLWRQGDFGYLLNINASDQDHDTHASKFAEILKSFEHLKSH